MTFLRTPRDFTESEHDPVSTVLIGALVLTIPQTSND